MKASWEFGGVLLTIAIVFALQFEPLAPADPTVRLLTAALVIVIAGGTMAAIRSRTKKL